MTDCARFKSAAAKDLPTFALKFHGKIHVFFYNVTVYLCCTMSSSTLKNCSLNKHVTQLHSWVSNKSHSSPVTNSGFGANCQTNKVLCFDSECVSTKTINSTFKLTYYIYIPMSSAGIVCDRPTQTGASLGSGKETMNGFQRFWKIKTRNVIVYFYVHISMIHCITVTV